MIFRCDVSKRQSVLSTAEKVKEDIGDVTILINNAGIMPAHPLEQHTEEEIRKIMDINVLAHFWVNTYNFKLRYCHRSYT